MDQTVFNKMTDDEKFCYVDRLERQLYLTEEERDAMRHALVSAQHSVMSIIDVFMQSEITTNAKNELNSIRTAYFEKCYANSEPPKMGRSTRINYQEVRKAAENADNT